MGDSRGQGIGHRGQLPACRPAGVARGFLRCRLLSITPIFCEWCSPFCCDARRKQRCRQLHVRIYGGRIKQLGQFTWSRRRKLQSFWANLWAAVRQLTITTYSSTDGATTCLVWIYLYVGHVTIFSWMLTIACCLVVGLGLGLGLGLDLVSVW